MYNSPDKHISQVAVKKKSIASISLDLDNQWSYMKIHGDSGWEKFPSYFDRFIPRVLDLLEQLNLKITFFIVGQDAALDKNKEYISQLVKNGHEVGNHSFHHASWLHLYPKEKIKSEILNAEENITHVTGKKPKGFRGPGFSWSKNLIEVLIELGYTYDASTLPTFVGPLARFYYFKTSKLTSEEKKERKKLFGTFKDGFRPIKPYYWKVNENKKLLEIPVTTIPFIKTPFHLSYLIYLNNISPFLMRRYLNMAITFCKATKTSPSFLLHPLDLIGGDSVPELKFFPGMSLKSELKTKIFIDVINFLSGDYELVNMSRHANSYITSKLSAA
jgi:hypothetical protein